MKTMTRAQLVAALSEEMGATKKDAGAALDALRAVIARTVAGGTPVVIPGICKVAPRSRPERTYRNPSNGTTFVKPAGTDVKVSAVKTLKDAVAG